MTIWCAAFLTIAAIDPAVFENDGVRIEASVVSQQYAWSVTNVDAPTITGFEIGHHNAYNAQAPDGWTEDSSLEWFRASAADPRDGLRPGQSGEFTDTVTTTGAVLGLVPATVRFADGSEMTFDAVWGPRPEPGIIYVVIASTIAGISLFHAVLLGRGS